MKRKYQKPKEEVKIQEAPVKPVYVPPERPAYITKTYPIPTWEKKELGSTDDRYMLKSVNFNHGLGVVQELWEKMY